VQLVGLNRPGCRNAVNRETAEHLYQAFTQFDSDPSLHVAVLHGMGGSFCAGYDLKELVKAGEGEDTILPGSGGGASPMVGTEG
jgi:enoyl-CoA hydratase/carnithine racemase